MIYVLTLFQILGRNSLGFGGSGGSDKGAVWWTIGLHTNLQMDKSSTLVQIVQLSLGGKGDLQAE